MPFINMKTNITVKPEECEELKKGFIEAISDTDLNGNSERWLMMDFEDRRNMYFAGSAEPTCMVEVDILHAASDDVLNKLTANITDVVYKATGIDPKRTYVKYATTEQWGWDDHNF